MLTLNPMLLTTLVTILVWIYFWVKKRKERQQIFKRYAIPGPVPEFFTGNVRQLNAAPINTDVISKWLKEYGNVFGYYVGEVPHLVVKDFTMLKRILIKEFHNFPNRTPMFIPMYPIDHSILALTGNRWKNVRATLTPTFSACKIKLMFKTMKEKAMTTTEVVAEKAQHGEPFDMYRVVQGLTLDVIADCTLAMKVKCQKNPNDQFLLAVRNFFLKANNKAVHYTIMFPMLKVFFGLISKYMTAGRLTDMIIKNLKNVIQQRRNDDSFKGNDLLQLMIESAVDDIHYNTSKGPKIKRTVWLTENEIIGNAYGSLLAGYETTATALALIFYLLVQHLDIQEKLYQEIIDNFPNDDELTYEGINSLQYLDQVIKEALRIYPPVTGFITRHCVNTCEIGQYNIPEGVSVFVPVWDIHHDPELWTDPWKFDPERFSPENKAKIDSMAYMPFGDGPRVCIGRRFALQEIKLLIILLLKKFIFVPCEKTENPLILSCPTVISTPKNGVFLRAKFRKP